MKKPLFSFVHVTDTHVTANKDVFTPLMEALQSECHHPRPDFVILTGDQVNGSTIDPTALERETAIFKERLGRLKIPCHLLLGNHDISGDSVPGVTFKKHFPDRDFFYSAELYPGFLGVFLSLEVNENGRTITFRDKMDWLIELLKKEKDKKILLFGHVGFFPPRKLVPADKVAFLTGPPWSKGGDTEKIKKWQAHYFALTEAEGGPLAKRISAFKNVVAYYCGHAHVNSCIVKDGLHHIMTSALCSTPWEYRYVQVFEDRMEHRCVQPTPPKDPTHFWPMCVDEDHSTPELYHWGNKDERDIIIKF